MEVTDCILSRRSVRKYLDISVERDKIGVIMEAGKAAPSAGNIQNWKFLLIENADKRKKIAEACLQQWWIAKAPSIIILVAEPDKVRQFYGIRGERLYSPQGCAAAAMSMLLEAHNQGLGSCWIGAFDEGKIKSLCNIPEQARPQAIITIGYPDENPPPPPEFSLEEVMFFRDFGGQPNRIEDIPAYLGEFSDKIDKGVTATKDFIKKLATPKKKK
tara:strand:- start:472 stop:1119 length:648 start_codon:yes stop_codon:yes gene_type:complete